MFFNVSQAFRPLTWILFVALSFLLLGFPPVRAEEDSPKMNSRQEELFRLTNKYRKDHGVAALKFDSQCELAAQAHAEDMARRQFYDHLNPEGQGLAQRYGKPWYSVGENIVMGTDLSASKAIRSWEKSKGHRKNMVSTMFTHLGVGVFKKGSQIYYVQCFSRPAQMIGENPLMIQVLPEKSNQQQ